MLSNSSNKIACSAIAGVAACGIAMGTNYYLDQRRSEYKTTGALLDAMTRDVEQDTQKLKLRAQTLNAVMDDDKKKLAQLDQEVRQGKVEQDAARKELRNIDANIAKIKQEQERIDDRIASYREAATTEAGTSGADIKRLDAQIENMQAEAAKLRKTMTALTAQRDSLSWGKAA